MRRIIGFLIVLAIAGGAAAGTVRGKVTYPDGSPYGKVAVQLERDGRAGVVYTGSDGMFLVENVPAGEYAVEVRTPKSTKQLRVTVTAAPITDVPPVRTP
jgi:hypothetical protein